MITIEDILKIGNNRKNFNKLLNFYNSGYLIPYIGAGLSVFANKLFNNKFYTWREYLNSCYVNCYNCELPNDANLYDIANKIETRMTVETFYANIQDTYGFYLNDEEWKIILKDAENEAIFEIPKLFKGPIITTNFDQILEKLFTPIVRIFLPNNKEDINELKDTIKRRTPSIYKIHGCVRDINSIIFTGVSYDNAYKNKSDLVTTLSDFYSGFSFLFIGCSLLMSKEGMDKPIELWTKLIDTKMDHFAILEEPENMAKRYNELRKYHITPIFYPKGRHDLIKVLLSELLTRHNNIIGQIPRYDSNFIGRKEVLESIDVHFNKLKITSLRPIFVLYGTGGIGKTRIMREFAMKKLKLIEYDNIIWLNAVSRTILISEIYQLLLDFNRIKINGNRTDKEILDVFKEWMVMRDILILLDNVEDFSDIQDLLEVTSLINETKIHFIITTRKSDAQNFTSAEITVFSSEEAQSFLYSYTNLCGNDYSKKIAETLGELPLALEQAAAYIKKQRIGYEHYWKLLNNSFDILQEGEAENGTLSVMAIWNISMRMIQNEAAKIFLNICAYFAPNNINCKWFKKIHYFVKGYPQLYNALMDDYKLEDIISELMEYSLIRKENDYIYIHLLTQDAIRRLCNAEMKEWVNIGIDILYKHKFNKITSHDSRQRFLEIVPHVDSLLKYCDWITKKSAALYHFRMYGFDKLNKYQEALKYEKETKDWIESAYSDNAKKIASTYNLFGVVYMNKGEYKQSRDYLTKALNIRKRVLDKFDQEIGKSHINLGILEYYTGNYIKSEKHYKQAITIKSRISNKTKRAKELAYAQTNLGALYDKISQRYNNKALVIHYEALKNRKNDCDENIAFALDNIGVIYTNLGNYIEALSYLRKALSIRKGIYNDEQNHPLIAQTCLNIANIYLNQEKYQEAWKLLETARKGYENTYTLEHYYTAEVYFIIAKYYYYQMEYADALRYLKMVLNFKMTNLKIKSSSDLEEIRKMIEKCETNLISEDSNNKKTQES